MALEPKRCEICGEVYEPTRTVSQKRWAERKYCSHACVHQSLIGRERSEEHRRNISKAKKGRKNPKQAAALRGRTIPEERKRRISETLKGRTREKNHAWKGDSVGYAALHYRNTKAFVSKNGCCEECEKSDSERPHDWAFLHHPEPHTENRDDYRYLCKSCHRKFDSKTP